jgi:hypothetical protein
MVVSFKLGLKLPNAWGGTDKTPTFESWIEKDGRNVLEATDAATCEACAVALEAVPADAGTV